MATHPIRFGIQAGQQNVAWPEFIDLFRKAEGWGYDSLWNFDHFLPIFSDPGGPCMEGWTTLSAIAAETKRARIGHLVNGNTYRHPCVTAKMATTLDHISGGRLNLGLGAGWFEAEHEAFGIDFRTLRGRLEALEEACIIIKGMLAQGTATLAGKHYQVRDALCRPEPIQAGGPPLMLGGVGRKVMLRIVARYADMWNARENPATMRELVDIIGEHGAAVGRNSDEIEKSVMLPLCYSDDADRCEMMCSLFGATFGVSPGEARAQMMVGGPSECMERIAEYVDSGITHFIFMCVAPYPLAELQGFVEEVAPEARAAFKA